MNVSKKFWLYRVLTTAYLINRLLSRIIHFQSPMEVLKAGKPNIYHLQIFGCVYYVHHQGLHCYNLIHCATLCIFLRYLSTKKRYACYNHQSQKLFISWDVRFAENQLYFSAQSPNKNLPQEESLNDPFFFPLCGHFLQILERLSKLRATVDQMYGRTKHDGVNGDIKCSLWASIHDVPDIPNMKCQMLQKKSKL